MTAIVAGDILVKGSVVTGAAGNSVANGGADTNLGKYCSTGTLADNTLNTLFTDATGAENAASLVTYQCYFIHNNNASNAYQNAVVWLSAQTASGASIDIWVDTTAASAVGAAPAQALTIANRTTAPAGSSFSAPTTQGTGLALGSIPVGNVKAVWVRRTCANTAALSPDDVTFGIAGDTGSL